MAESLERKARLSPVALNEKVDRSVAPLNHDARKAIDELRVLVSQTIVQCDARHLDLQEKFTRMSDAIHKSS